MSLKTQQLNRNINRVFKHKRPNFDSVWLRGHIVTPSGIVSVLKLLNDKRRSKLMALEMVIDGIHYYEEVETTAKTPRGAEMVVNRWLKTLNLQNSQ